MKFKAEIDVMPHDALLDPQGKAVTNSMKTIGLSSIEGVRIGKHISYLWKPLTSKKLTRLLMRHVKKCW